MADDILAATPCAHNPETPTTLLYQDTRRLAELFRLTYEDYAKRSMVETQAFVGALRVLVEEHIEPICQKNPNGSTDYQTYHDQFTQYDNGDFTQHLTILDSLTFGMANLVRCAVDSFRALNYPQEYSAFLGLLEAMFNNDTMIEQGKQREAYILLEQLRQKP